VALKVELKPNERIVIGNVVLRNGDSRARFFIEGHAPILREKDILTAETADSPARRIYLAVQLMYLSGDASAAHANYFALVKDFLAAAPSSLPMISEINNLILNAELYKALKTAKKLIDYEAELIGNATRG
jgi:flagellar biosynthesis repressor protein FlbT